MFARQTVCVTIVGFAIGSLTSLGQGMLPFVLSPLANSAGSWSLAAFALALGNRQPRRGALLGFASLASTLAGYAMTSTMRGNPVGPSLVLFWGVASVVVGPVLGVGAAWVRGSGPTRVAAGGAAIAGILVGEGAYGLTVIGTTTPAGYWIAQIVVGLGIVVAISVRRLGSLQPAAICVAFMAVVAAALYISYSANLTSLL